MEDLIRQSSEMVKENEDEIQPYTISSTFNTSKKILRDVIDNKINYNSGQLISSSRVTMGWLLKKTKSWGKEQVLKRFFWINPQA